MSTPDPTNPNDLTLWRRCAGRASPGSGSCPDASALAAWLDGRASVEEQERIEAHLAECRACLAAARDVRSIQAAGPDEAVLPSPAVLRRARALVALPVRRPEPARFAWLRDRLAPARRALAAAAVLLSCILGYRLGRLSFDEGSDSRAELMHEMSFGVINGTDGDAGLLDGAGLDFDVSALPLGSREEQTS